MPPNQMALHPNWLIMYVIQIILPMLMLVVPAIKILIKHGRDFQIAFDMESSIYDVEF